MCGGTDHKILQHANTSKGRLFSSPLNKLWNRRNGIKSATYLLILSRQSVSGNIRERLVHFHSFMSLIYKISFQDTESCAVFVLQIRQAWVLGWIVWHCFSGQIAWRRLSAWRKSLASVVKVNGLLPASNLYYTEINHKKSTGQKEQVITGQQPLAIDSLLFPDCCENPSISIWSPPFSSLMHVLIIRSRQATLLYSLVKCDHQTFT